MTEWNYGDHWSQIAAVIPDAPAIHFGDRTVSWGEFHRSAAGVASWLIGRGVRPKAKVACFLYNAPEYLTTVFGAFLLAGVPVNTNYRYGPDELAYLWENADAEALVFHGSLADRVDEVRARVPTLRHFLFVDDGAGPCPPWATPFDEAAATAIGELPERSPDDLLFLYTGGTTGMPKGVMWRQDDLFDLLNISLVALMGSEQSPAHAVAAVTEHPGGAGVPACPLMHGTGLFGAMQTLSLGGAATLLQGRRYDATELAAVIDRHAVQLLFIVGDPFARPLLEVLDRDPGRFSITSLSAIVSSGAMWSTEVKEGLLRHHPGMLLLDAFSSSEAIGMGSSISTGDAAERTARFTLGPNVRVVDDDDRDVVAGSETVGRLVLGGRLPLGYYKDETKSATTFRTIDGKRYSVPGDMAKVNADGSIQLLGRGNQCINTAGEKVFPEEVEEALKTHPAVADACVVGVPDPKWGQAVVAAVELARGGVATEDELIGHVRTRLAHYKAPRAVRIVATIGRAPNGKMDYARHQRELADAISAP